MSSPFTEPQNGWGWQGLLERVWSDPLLGQGKLEQAVQAGSEYLRGWSLHPKPELDHPHGKKVSSRVRVEFHVCSLCPRPPALSVGTTEKIPAPSSFLLRVGVIPPAPSQLCAGGGRVSPASPGAEQGKRHRQEGHRQLGLLKKTPLHKSGRAAAGGGHRAASAFPLPAHEQGKPASAFPLINRSAVPAFGAGNPSPPPSVTLRAPAPSAPHPCRGQQTDAAAGPRRSRRQREPRADVPLPSPPVRTPLPLRLHCWPLVRKMRARVLPCSSAARVPAAPFGMGTNPRWGGGCRSCCPPPRPPSACAPARCPAKLLLVPCTTGGPG